MIISLEQMVLDYQRVSLAWHGHGHGYDHDHEHSGESLSVGDALRILGPIANQELSPSLSKQALSLVYKIVYGPHADPSTHIRRMRR